jgi:hypothetical protein
MIIGELARGSRTPASLIRCGEKLPRRKQQESDLRMSRLHAMRRLVDRVEQCECAELADCRIAATVMGTAR